MRKSKAGKVIGGIMLGIVVLTISAVLLLNTSYVQSWLLREATDLLTEKLHTRVSIDSVSVSLFSQKLTLHDVSVDDLQQHQLISLRQLSLNLALSKLLHREVIIEEARIAGLEAHLLSAKKTEDSVANYQFIIDAFSPHPSHPHPQTTKRPHPKIQFDINHLHLQDIHLTYDDAELSLQESNYDGGQLLIDSLRVKTDNHLPRKNARRPHRGYFDTGHLDITTSMRWTVNSLKDSIDCTLTQCSATDAVTGINLTDLRLSLALRSAQRDACPSKNSPPLGRNRGWDLIVRDLVLQQTNTVINVPRAVIHLPSSPREGQGVGLSYSADNITGKTLLKDISRPFAPVLKDFKIPLNLSLNLSGTDSTMTFSNVRVSTNDRKLTIAASGGIDHLKDAHRLAVRFHVSRMNAKGDIKERIINQFPVKKYMMKQLQRLGDISYAGRFAILWHREEFQGELQTAGGPIDFQFALDENTKYVSGKVAVSEFQLGEVIEIKHIGPIDCHADFRFDYSKPRTALMRKEKGGKLPIGEVNALVDKGTYRGIKIKNLSVEIKSDGAEATGNIMQSGRHHDLYCSFTFTDTDAMHEMKITNPGIKFHKAKQE